MSGWALLSHFEPSLHLRQHLTQVCAAAAHLFEGHSAHCSTHRPETAAVLTAVVRGHDLGKGSQAFQDYIANPARYRGEAHAKEHSVLSAAMMVLWAKARGWDALPILALTQAIAGHHSGFATLDRLEDRLRLEEEDALLEQWSTLDRQALGQDSGLDLAETEGEFEDVRRWLFRRRRVGEYLHALPLAEAVGFRLWTQFLSSILLEADKAFLALDEELLRRYFHQPRANLAPECVDARLASLPDTPLNRLRRELRAQIRASIDSENPCRILTLPTGTGKTLLAATWALDQRAKLAAAGPPPRIIIALPFLSIVDQTEQEFRALLGLDPTSRAQSERLLASHSLSHAEYEVEGVPRGVAYTRFFLDTWRSEIIVTTFDQLLLALFSPKTRHQMRFHALMDALIILDEIQTLPCQLWDLVDHALRGLTLESTTRVLLMSATQPALLTGTHELAGDSARVAAIFGQFRRYRLRFRYRVPQALDSFIQTLLPRLAEWRMQGRRVLITLNTRSSAKAVWRAAHAHLPGTRLWLISADVTPRDRLEKIAAIKALSQAEPGIVISTQTIEAGVDIDMDIVVRDFAPLDALVQVAGRCNRHNRLGDHGGEVEIVSLRSPKGGLNYADIIYDRVLLDVTREVLAVQPETLGEESVLELSQSYFDLIRLRKNIGAELTEAFARWGEMPDIQRLLRGERVAQTAFLVLGDSENWLRLALESALAITDRWERREAVRALGADIQQRTVTIYTRRGFYPEDYADPVGPFWILRPGYYQPDTGLELGLDEVDPATCIL